MNDYLFNLIDQAALSAPVYRTAMRLARRADAAGHVTLSHEDARELCGTESDHTVRSHLIALHEAGLINYRRNGSIWVFWNLPAGENDGEHYVYGDRVAIKMIDQRSRRSPDDQIDRQTITNDITYESSDRQTINLIATPSPLTITEHQPVIVEIPPTPPNKELKALTTNTSQSSSSGRARTCESQGAAAAKANYQTVKAVYENNFGLLTPLLADSIKAACRDYPEEWMLMAMERAVSAGKRRWDYVQGILRNWSTEGFDGYRSSARADSGRMDRRPGSVDGANRAGSGAGLGARSGATPEFLAYLDAAVEADRQLYAGITLDLDTPCGF